ncbi:hypothetical protein [Pseudoroseicyclus sp. CXY001]|uniref:hypothetical protein n=1 Tax=Pseudoroseicyclus sp. CXY001 TaxID=3242492 RepID=UPI0035711C38
MSILEEIADKLAIETIKVMDALGDDQYFNQVAKEIGSSSQTMEEAFLTAMRMRLAERRAKAMLRAEAERIAEARGKPKA